MNDVWEDSIGVVRKEEAFHNFTPNIHEISFCGLSTVSQINLISTFFLQDAV
jgi:hypothetical protein